MEPIVVELEETSLNQWPVEWSCRWSWACRR